MAQLWGGRFTKETDKEVYAFNASINFDKRLIDVDIKGSIVHAKMLAKQNIISDADKDSIINGLNSILSDVKSGNILITEEYEDVHSFVEANLIDRIEIGRASCRERV